MNQLNKIEIELVDNLIKEIFKKKKIILTTGIFEFKYSKFFNEKYKVYNLENLLNNDLEVKKEIIIIENCP